MIFQQGGRLCYHYDAQTLWIEPWGEHSLRVRATCMPDMPEQNWALLDAGKCAARISIGEDGASIENGKLRATLSKNGKLMFYNADGKLLLEEYTRNRRDLLDPKCGAIEVEGRELKPIPGGHWHVTARFESLSPDEKLYGMGQYQQPCLDLKGTDLELAHRNTQASVPFLVSSLGYGLLWNNPAVGRAVLGKNIMSFEAYATQALDYWVTAGDTPAQLVRRYADVTGKVPMMPEYGLGFWQSKLCYQTQDELMEVAREHKRRGLPMDVIVADAFHWAVQGDFCFNPKYWPDPAGMVRELHEMGIELLVSVWPTVDKKHPVFEELLEKGYLVQVDRGARVTQDCMGNTLYYDATNPEARAWVWDKYRKNYFDLGVRAFWLDEAEPEFIAYDYEIYRYHMGPVLEVGNLYPNCYAQTFYDGQRAAGQEQIVNLSRCAWAGAQRYGVLVWSGDIPSSFVGMRDQLAAGLNMGLAGIPWWTTDIGGFHGGNPDDPAFRELFARWFEWGAFCPVFRLHGRREPMVPGVDTTGEVGSPNEVWSFGEEVYGICEKYLKLRESLRPYIRELMRQAHEHGDPVMRTLFYVFPEDKASWNVGDEYMFGDKYLVAPVLYAGSRSRAVYLPAGARWRALEGGPVLEGGQTVEADAPLDVIPVFERV